MKPTQWYKIPRQGDPKFTEVATSIAKGPPPDWLVPGLTFFAEFIHDTHRIAKDTPRRAKRTLDQMDRAAELLIKTLPRFGPPTLGMELPWDVATALVVLPQIRERIAYALGKPGKSSMISPDTCATVVTEAWERIHGKAQARSEYLYKACREYWIACGNEQHEESIENWRHRVEKAVEDDRQFIKMIFDRSGKYPATD
jgi:hypothetical protein